MSVLATTLAGEACIHLHGEDIPRFLQGQLTCDMRRLSPQRAVAGAMCNVQGRVISDLWVLPVATTHCVLRLRRSLAETFAANLARYARFSRIDVSVDPRVDAVVGLYGDLAGASIGVPDDIGACVHEGGVLTVRTGPTVAERVSVDLTAPEGAQRPADIPVGDAQQWDAELLRSGHYAIESVDSESFTPQALNYDLTGRVAFDKGCYTGQEVVARLHYRGQSKRRLQVLGCAGDEPIARAAAVLDESGRSVGEVLRWSKDGSGQALVAAMTRADVAGLTLQLADGRELGALAPP